MYAVVVTAEVSDYGRGSTDTQLTSREPKDGDMFWCGAMRIHVDQSLPHSEAVSDERSHQATCQGVI